MRYKLPYLQKKISPGTGAVPIATPLIPKAVIESKNTPQLVPVQKDNKGAIGKMLTCLLIMTLTRFDMGFSGTFSLGGWGIGGGGGGMLSPLS